METNTIIEALIRVQEDLLNKYKSVTSTIDILTANNGFIYTVEAKATRTPGSMAQGDLKKNNFYSNPDTVDNRILSILKEENKFLQRREIEDIAEKKLGKPFKTSIASSLSSIKKKENSNLCLININNNNSVWGFKEWLDENGQIKPDHLYNGARQIMFN